MKQIDIVGKVAAVLAFVAHKKHWKFADIF